METSVEYGQALGRLINLNNVAEGSVLQPRRQGEFFVPVISGLRLERVDPTLGGVTVILSWEEPSTISLSRIAEYRAYVIGLEGTSKPQGPFSSKTSPLVLTLSTSTSSVLTVVVQTVLKSGLVSDLETSPSVTFDAIPAALTNADTEVVTYDSPSLFTGLRINGTPSTPTPVLANQDLGIFGGGGFDGVGFSTLDGALTVRSAENFAPGAHGTTAVLLATPLGSASATDILRANGNGSISARIGRSSDFGTVPATFSRSVSDVSNTGTGETTLHTHTVNANSLTATGDCLLATFTGTFAATPGSKRLRVKIAGVTIYDSGTLALTTAETWTANATIYRTGATTAKAVVTISSTAAIPNGTYATPSVTWAAANSLEITGQGGASADITARASTVSFLPA